MNSARDRVMNALNDAGRTPTSQSQIAQHARMSQSLVSRILKQLIQERLVYVERTHRPLKYVLYSPKSDVRPISGPEMAGLLKSWAESEFKLRIHSQLENLRKVMIALYRNALAGAEGEAINPESLRTYREAVRSAHSTAVRLQNVCEMMLSQPNLWDSVELTTFLLEGQTIRSIESHTNKLDRSGG